MHEVLINCLGGLSLHRKSVVRLTDHADMTSAVYCGRKTTTLQPQKLELPLAGTDFYNPKPVPATEVLMYNNDNLNINL